MFDCAFKPFRGERSIHYMAHLKMMAAAQPFISGAISKTVNLPKECTVEDITDAYVQAWKLGLKCVAIYRDGSKRSQPLNTAKTGEGTEQDSAPAVDERIQELEEQLVGLQKQIDQPLRRRLPETRTAVTHKFDIAGHEGYLTIGMFEDGTPGEMFITMAKEGSTIGGLMDSVAALTSISLQYGVPLDEFISAFIGTKFEPSGKVEGNDRILSATSILDYIFRELAISYQNREDLAHTPAIGANDESNIDDQNSEDQNQLLKIVKDITSKGFVRNNYKKKLVDLSDIRINLKGKK